MIGEPRALRESMRMKTARSRARGINFSIPMLATCSGGTLAPMSAFPSLVQTTNPPVSATAKLAPVMPASALRKRGRAFSAHGLGQIVRIGVLRIRAQVLGKQGCHVRAELVMAGSEHGCDGPANCQPRHSLLGRIALSPVVRHAFVSTLRHGHPPGSRLRHVGYFLYFLISLKITGPLSPHLDTIDVMRSNPRGKTSQCLELLEMRLFGLFARSLRGRKPKAKATNICWNNSWHSRDELAFAALLQRHGPMVLSACLRVLRDNHLAEDAFQATFLVLAVKAATIRKRGSVASWLYGVGCTWPAISRPNLVDATCQTREKPANLLEIC